MSQKWMRPDQEGDQKVLEKKYENLPDDASVAYVDESYRLPHDCRGAEEPFYLMTAVLLCASELDDVRGDMCSIAGGPRWHTSELRGTDEGCQKIEEMMDYLAKYRDPCVVAVAHTPGQGQTAIEMRRLCLTGLLQTLESDGVPQGRKVKLVVLEKQQEPKDTKRDLHTVSAARSDNRISRGLQIQHVSPAVEHLLWLPDTVSNVYRRLITHGDALVQQISGQTVTVCLSGAKSDPLAAAAHIQGVSRLFP